MKAGLILCDPKEGKASVLDVILLVILDARKAIKHKKYAVITPIFKFIFKMFFSCKKKLIWSTYQNSRSQCNRSFISQSGDRQVLQRSLVI